MRKYQLSVPSVHALNREQPGWTGKRVQDKWDPIKPSKCSVRCPSCGAKATQENYLCHRDGATYSVTLTRCKADKRPCPVNKIEELL